MVRVFAGACIVLSMLSATNSGIGAQSSPSKKRAAASTPQHASRLSNSQDTLLLGTWRISRGVLAPWLPAADKSWDAKSWVGQTIRFEPHRVSGPQSLRCAGDVNYEATNYSADALFQGALPSPLAKAVAAATELGFGKLPARGTSLNCDAGLFEFHQVDATTELVAINNVIWTMDRSPGALASATAPAGVVQRFLEAHLAGRLDFDSASFGATRNFLSTGLAGSATKYFAKPVTKGAASEVHGDPFTDTQALPTRFSVGVGRTTANAATVQVTFSDAHAVKTVTYLLTMESGTWRIDDVRYGAGASFRALLASR